MSFLVLKSISIFVLALFASFIGTTTGGIGLLIVPALILFGLPAHVAIATTRLAVFLGDIVSLRKFHQAKKVDWNISLPIFLLSLVGGIIGAKALIGTPDPLAEKLLGVFILFVFFFSLWKRNVGVLPGTVTTAARRTVGYFIMFLLSIFAAYFSAAAGMLGRTTLITFFGQTYLQSAATRKIQGIAVGIVALAIFSMSGLIDPFVSMLIVPAMLLGFQLGSVYALKKGDAWVRNVFLAMVFFAALQLLFKS